VQEFSALPTDHQTCSQRLNTNSLAGKQCKQRRAHLVGAQGAHILLQLRERAVLAVGHQVHAAGALAAHCSTGGVGASSSKHQLPVSTVGTRAARLRNRTATCGTPMPRGLVVKRAVSRGNGCLVGLQMYSRQDHRPKSNCLAHLQTSPSSFRRASQWAQSPPPAPAGERSGQHSHSRQQSQRRQLQEAADSRGTMRQRCPRPCSCDMHLQGCCTARGSCLPEQELHCCAAGVLVCWCTFEPLSGVLHCTAGCAGVLYCPSPRLPPAPVGTPPGSQLLLLYCQATGLLY